jgi:DNA-binding GntR family transcriptional regulator
MTRVAKHEQVREILRAELLAMGDSRSIETERELAVRFGVSRMTVRQALGALREEGVIRSVRGVGTFSSRPTLSKGPALTSFSEDLASRGYRATTRVVAATLESASADVAIDLGVPIGTAVYRLERIRLADDIPLCLEVVHLAAARFPQLLEHELTDSLYSLLESAYGVSLRRGEQTVRAVNMGEYESDLLDVSPGAAALHIKRITTDQTGRVVERGMAICRGDLYDYHFVVTRP